MHTRWIELLRVKRAEDYPASCPPSLRREITRAMLDRAAANEMPVAVRNAPPGSEITELRVTDAGVLEGLLSLPDEYDVAETNVFFKGEAWHA